MKKKVTLFGGGTGSQGPCFFKSVFGVSPTSLPNFSLLDSVKRNMQGLAEREGSAQAQA